MKIPNLTPILNYAFNYVAKFSKIYNIDESHALKHSMETFRLAIASAPMTGLPLAMASMVAMDCSSAMDGITKAVHLS